MGQDDSKAGGQPESQPESKPETKDEEPKAESKEEEEPKAESKEEEEPKAEGKEEEEEEEDKGPEQAVLTEEDEKIWFTKPSVADLTDQVLEKHFSEFSIPDKDEGFDEVTFEWQKEKESKQYVQNWVLERKRTTRMEHLQPSGWFKTQAAEFSKKLQEWQTKQKTAQETAKKKPDDDEDLDKDIFTIQDICDVGDGEPLFLNFTPEDWALMSLRWELHLLAAAFKKDVDDPDRTEIPEQHMAFYYYKYFKKNLAPKGYGKDTLAELVQMMKNTAEHKAKLAEKQKKKIQAL